MHSSCSNFYSLTFKSALFTDSMSYFIACSSFVFGIQSIDMHFIAAESVAACLTTLSVGFARIDYSLDSDLLQVINDF